MFSFQVTKRTRLKEKVSFPAGTSSTTDSSIPFYQTQKTIRDKDRQEMAHFNGKILEMSNLIISQSTTAFISFLVVSNRCFVEFTLTFNAFFHPENIGVVVFWFLGSNFNSNKWHSILTWALQNDICVQI